MLSKSTYWISVFIILKPNHVVFLCLHYESYFRSVKSMVVSILVQLAFVATIVPHHFAFVVTALRILFLCAKELNIAKRLVGRDFLMSLFCVSANRH